MAEYVEINVNLDTPHGLFLKENESGIDDALLKSLQGLKDIYKNAQWLGLLDSPKTENQERLMEFAESRRCLLAALLKIESNSKKGAPSPEASQEIHVSLSHTKTYSAAFVVLDNEEIIGGVGIDIESKNRKIKPEVQSKFVFDFEERLDLTPLELWTIKEASFKAHSNRINVENPENSKKSAGTLFQFEIDEYDPVKREGLTVKVQEGSDSDESDEESPSNSAEFQMYSHDELLVTIALSSR